MTAVHVLHGDSRDVLRGLPDNSIDSVVSDAPYVLTSIVKRFGKPDSAPARGAGMYQRLSDRFLGESWDVGDTVFCAAFWREVMRVLKPGGHIVVASHSTTYHRLTCAIEDAGFEIRDMIDWLYTTGVPKSHNHDRAGEVYGSGLKGAKEPWCLARKPLDGSLIANARKWGTGTLAVDACRSDGGRWPANVVTDGSFDFSPFYPCAKATKADRAGSQHPTVKPVALMQWLCRLVTPPGGVVLDPFAGSGTTGAAAMREGFGAILIEREARYVADIQRRIMIERGGRAE